MRLFPGRLLVAAGVIAVLSGGVARAETTFYEAYQKGLAHEKEGAWKDARDSFLRAAELRPAPARRVKAYGLNFIEPYDPAIHLARASLHLGLLDDARRNLKIAESAAVSPRAEIAALGSEIEAARLRVAAAQQPPEIAATPATSPTKPERAAPPGAATALPAPRPTSAAAFAPEGAPIAPLAPTAGAPPPFASSATPRAGAETFAPPTPVKVAPSQAAAPSPRPGAAEPPAVATSVPSGPDSALPTSIPAPGAGGPAGAEGAQGDRPSLGWIALIASALGLVVLVAVRAVLARRARRPVSQLPAAAEGPFNGPVTAADTGNQSRATKFLAAERTPSSPTNAPGTAPTPSGARPLRAGTDPRFGPYTLEGILGRGGMGTTYVARRARDGFPVALKVPHEHILEEPEFIERFLREGSLGAMLHHPNIVRIFEAGEYEGRPFIAMEIVPGESLEKALKEEPRLPLVRALHVARGIALALDYAHMKGIVHRDLKPDNVMLLPDGEIKVMDYGIARRMDVSGLTATNVYLGTPAFSAPESVVPSEVGPQSDLYSLGIILFRVLAGYLPFVAPTSFEILHKHVYEPLPALPPDVVVPAEVYGLIQELTAKRKEERYATAELFLRDLDKILNHL